MHTKHNLDFFYVLKVLLQFFNCILTLVQKIGFHIFQGLNFLTLSNMIEHFSSLFQNFSLYCKMEGKLLQKSKILLVKRSAS